MTNEVFDLMAYFPGSRLTSSRDVILSEKGNVSFSVDGVEDRNTIICKLLEWCSRAMAKGQPYSSERSNRQWRRSLLLGLNNYLGTNFTESDIWIIYDLLGNAINHKRTLRFIDSGFDMSVLRSDK